MFNLSINNLKQSYYKNNLNINYKNNLKFLN